MRVFIIGHKSPDLDSIAAAVEYAEFLKKQKRYEGAQFIPVRAGEANAEARFVFKKAGSELPKPLNEYEIDSTDAFILVDHNEESQRHEKVAPEQIIEIVDHHKINLSFTSPIRLDVKPLGATSTLIFELFEMYGHKPSKKTASLMLAAILSDTQGLKSSTTTGLDSTIARQLASELNLDIEKLTFEIFKAKSDITGLSVEEIVTKDYKIMDFGGTKVFVNQIETVEPEKILNMKTAIIKALNETKSKLGVSLAFNIITDILKTESQIIYETEEEGRILEQAFTTEAKNGVADIGPKTSRKKDINPEIERVVTS